MHVKHRNGASTQYVLAASVVVFGKLARVGEFRTSDVERAPTWSLPFSSGSFTPPYQLCGSGDSDSTEVLGLLCVGMEGAFVPCSRNMLHQH